ncbi:MAG TPA: hypothetical protein VIH42_04400 [Thermoguttaceae bacterium]
MHYKLILVGLLIGLIIGCSESSPPNAASTPTQQPAADQTETRTPPPPPPPESSDSQPAAQTQRATHSAETSSAASKADSAPESPTPGPGMEMRKAEVGVGEKGHGYSPGIITTPIATYFTVKERLVFEVEIPHALQLFKAMENRAPRTQQEFMNRIIKENNIRLPDLPHGHRYVYDPKTEELLVERPAQ